MAPAIPPDIGRYLDALLLAGLEPQREALFARLNRFIFTAYINSLAPRDRARVERMVAAGRPLVEVEEFVHDHVSNLPTVYQTALAEFRTLYLREVTQGGRTWRLSGEVPWQQTPLLFAYEALAQRASALRNTIRYRRSQGGREP
jgi:hypothetical protein